MHSWATLLYSTVLQKWDAAPATKPFFATTEATIPTKIYKTSHQVARRGELTTTEWPCDSHSLSVYLIRLLWAGMSTFTMWLSSDALSFPPCIE